METNKSNSFESLCNYFKAVTFKGKLAAVVNQEVPKREETFEYALNSANSIDELLSIISFYWGSFNKLSDERLLQWAARTLETISIMNTISMETAKFNHAGNGRLGVETGLICQYAFAKCMKTMELSLYLVAAKRGEVFFKKFTGMTIDQFIQKHALSEPKTKKTYIKAY